MEFGNRRTAFGYTFALGQERGVGTVTVVDGGDRGVDADVIGDGTGPSSSSSSPPSSSSSSSSDGTKRRRKKKKSGNSKDLRREFIGMAKAVDRGQWANVYSPGGDDGFSFTAKSGLPDRQKLFTVLGIESSCDDTGAAVVRSDGLILGESLASQHAIHEEFGGVVPALAKAAHESQIDRVVTEALSRAGLSSVADVDGIGVTVGPGLEICLRVGCEKARGMAMEHGKVFVGVHHLEAHILMARLPFEGGGDGDGGVEVGGRALLDFPFLALLVSGGHCQLLKCLGVGRYTIIGGTIDDSLGEAYDKIARLLNLPVGGGSGPAVESPSPSHIPSTTSSPATSNNTGSNSNSSSCSGCNSPGPTAHNSCTITSPYRS